MPTDRQNQTQSRRTKPSARRTVQRGIIAQISMALFQPMAFFESLMPMRQTRQWLWIGAIILGLIGVSAVQQATSSDTTPDTGIPPISDPFNPGIQPDFGGGFDFPPPPSTDGTPAPTESDQTISNWTIALVASSHWVLIWAIQATMFSVIPMFKGKPPQFGENLQIAIYATLPIGVMAGLQLIFMAAGGKLGAIGLTGLINELPFYETATPFLRAVLYSLASQTTLFMLWSLLMLYFGGRAVLGGYRPVVLLVIIAWAIVLVITPVVTGAIQADTPATIADESIPQPDFGVNTDMFDFQSDTDMFDLTITPEVTP